MQVNEPALGLRERKKEQTRQLIAETARRLFVERGFAQVTVGQIARAADVAEQTVYNYFPTKEDLVYWRLESFEEELLAAIRERAPGESVLAAFWQWMLRPHGLLDGQPVAEGLAAIGRVISESPALRVREQQVFERYTDSLAGLLASETGAEPDAIEPWVAANALMGLHRGLVSYARRRILDGARNPGLARDLRARAEEARAMLATGLAGYAEKVPPPDDAA
jgi:AcrR family transcriptional regulator